jgi:hypothetical protein
VISAAGKRMLLLVPVGQYSSAIKSAFEGMGVNVDCFEERPSLGVTAKTLLRYSPRLIHSFTQRYFDTITEATKSNDYDLILVIRGEAITGKALRDLRTYHKNAVVLLYQWDSMSLTKGPIEKLHLFDRCLSFDKVDCAKFSMEFLPLFYVDDYENIAEQTSPARYDFAFVGTIHSDRYRILKHIEQYAGVHSMSTYFYMYIPSPVVYYKLRYFDGQLPSATKREFMFRHLSRPATVQIVNDARILVDSEHPAQRGLTMRTIEALGARRKLVTTNPDVVNYDFYDPNNILVINRDRIEIPDAFINSAYREVERSIYEGYSVHQWASALLNGSKVQNLAIQ